jgi:hypothetical protein
MSKKLGCLFSSLLLFVTFCMPFVIWGNELKNKLTRYAYSLSPHPASKVLSYKTEIEQELQKYNLEEFTPVLLAIMYQESRGEGNDPMQASESAGLKRNEIQNPSVSIQQGVFHFYQMYKLGKKSNVDMNTIIQSYNMGPGYIRFVAANGCKHTEELAKAYSKIQADQHPDLYTCGGFKGNFRYPYCFGDFTYTKKVNEKVSIVEKELKRSNPKSISYLKMFHILGESIPFI